MAMSKRMREQLLKEEEKLPPVPPPRYEPINDNDRAKFKRLDALFNKLSGSQTADLYLVQELLKEASFLHDFGSIRLWDLKRKFSHYQTLTQEAAKQRLWDEMHGIISGLHTEAGNAKAAMERDGKRVHP